MSKQTIHWLAICILCASCAGDKTKQEAREIITYPLDQLPDEPADLKLSAVFSAVEIVPLETRPECLVTDASVVIQAGNSFLVSTTIPGQPAQIYRFDEQGKYLNTIGSPGRGPGEHLGNGVNFMYMQYFPEDESVLVNWGGGMGAKDYPQRFTLDGKYLDQVITPRSMMVPVRISGDTWLSAMTWTGSTYAKTEPEPPLVFALYKNNGEVLDSMRVQKLSDRMSLEDLNGGRSILPSRYDPNLPVFHINGLVRLYMEGNDTVFNYANGKLEPAYVLDRGKESRPYGVLFETKDMLGKSTVALALETTHNIFLVRTKVTAFEKGPMNFLSEIKTKSLVIIDKETKKAKPVKLEDDFFGLLTDNLNSSGANKGHNRHIMWHGSGDKVIVSVQALELREKFRALDRTKLSPEFNRKLDVLANLAEDSNPVLFVFTRSERVVMD